MSNSIIDATHYFLPLSSETIALITQNHQHLMNLSVPELAAVLLIQNLPSLVRTTPTTSRIESALAEAIKIGFASNQEADPLAFSRAVHTRFSLPAFQVGLKLLDSLQLNLLDDEIVQAQKYLNPDQTWDFEFRIEHAENLNPLKHEAHSSTAQTIVLTNAQYRIFTTIRNELDEHLHLQGLAGVGKTSMISTLMEFLKPEKTLLLAHTAQQLAALTTRLGTKKFVGMTFGQLASTLLFTPPSTYRRPERQRYQPTYQMSDAETGKVLGFQPVGGLTIQRVANICRVTVQSYCYSKNATISSDNLPLLDDALDDIDIAVLLTYSKVMWQEITQPRLLFEGRKTHLPIRVYHLLKLLSLDYTITLGESLYNHIIIDESHDLSPALLQFLDRCPQATCTLGDICQRLDGLPPQRGGHVRQREMFQSVRSGRQMEAILNPLIAAHPRAELAPLVGAPDKKTIIEYYDRSEIPSDGTTILVKGEWGMFEWFQRLAGAGASFCMLHNSERQFRLFVNDCIELYHHGSPPKHSTLFRHSTWENIAKAYGKNPSFNTIETMLQRGYTSMDFERSMDKMDRTGTAKIRLGRVSDVRSIEIDQVMLGRDLLLPVRRGDKDEKAKAIAALYTGSSRARYRLVVPGDMRDWLIDHKRPI